MQAPFLALALIALLVALLASWTRRASLAAVHNTISMNIDCDVAEAREGVRQLTADIERLNRELLSTDRQIMGLKVRTMEARDAVRIHAVPGGASGDTTDKRQFAKAATKTKAARKPR